MIRRCYVTRLLSVKPPISCYISAVQNQSRGLTINLNSVRFNSNMAADSSSPPKKMRIDDRLVWVDLEMTGLDVSKEEIMEAAVLVTDGDLNIVAEGPNIILKVAPEVLDNMGEWCQKQHGQSGLTEKCLKSDITLAAAQDQMVKFLEEHAQSGTAPLAGNSIGADKKFLEKYMPQFMSHLHYRVVDVSTIKELCRRWYPKEYAAAPKKAGSHRALDDIKESIKELQYYRTAVFK